MMDLNYFFGISGLIIGVLGIWITIKLKNKVSLSLINLESYSIFNNFTDKSSLIKIEYSNKPVSRNLLYFKICIINDGNNDIDRSNLWL